jgi:hypothetical protein
MIPTKKITILLLLAVIVILGGWDIYVAANAHSGDTISEIVLAASIERPIIPFVLGVVCGHLFWPQTKEPNHAS